MGTENMYVFEVAIPEDVMSMAQEVDYRFLGYRLLVER